jgi:maleylpyruvate isomerase
VDEGIPSQLLLAVADAQQRLDEALALMDATLLREPSLLPRWTRAHVLAHLAANSDSQLRRSSAAVDGINVDQYVGGAYGREREIETRSAQDAASLVRDVKESGAALHDCWQAIEPAIWSATTKQVSGPDLLLRDLPLRRWQEIEVHLVDLDIGTRYQSWSEEFVNLFLPRLRASEKRRIPEGQQRPTTKLDERTELAWLYGRVLPEGFPVLLPWG